jgi:hypothetical protein
LAHRKEYVVVFNNIETKGTHINNIVDDYLLTWIEAFIIDRKTRGLAVGTLQYYRKIK